MNLATRWFRGVLSVVAFGVSLSTWTATETRAELSVLPLAETNRSTLNDLIRRVPIQSRMRERELAGLSAVQEQMILHERRMCGEGLPLVQQSAFSGGYRAIVAAIVDERISRAQGRAFLDRHRALLASAYRWAVRPYPDAAYGENLVESLLQEQALLETRSKPLLEVMKTARTPLITGHLLWVEELLIWGGSTDCHFVSLGELGKIASQVRRLERFEGYYKQDHRLTDRERSELHRRLIEIHRTTIDSFAS